MDIPSGRGSKVCGVCIGIAMDGRACARGERGGVVLPTDRRALGHGLGEKGHVRYRFFVLTTTLLYFLKTANAD